MDFEPSEDRRMLAETLDRYLAHHYPMDHRNAVAYASPFCDPDKWSEMADLGVLMALVPETLGGFGGQGFDILTVFQSLGRALCPEPVLGALMAARVLGPAGHDLGPLMQGTLRYGVATGQPVAVKDLRLSGRCSVVYGGALANRFLVPGPRDVVFEVRTQDVRMTPYGLVDGGGAVDLFLDKTPATQVSDQGIAAATWAGQLALCAEALGAMDVAQGLVLDYVKERSQFGRAIGSFQAIQHRLVDLANQIEQARSIVILAASKLDEPGGARYVSMAKSLVGRVAKTVSEECIQLHGGIAMTWEHPMSHYGKRLVMMDHQLGHSDSHLARVAAAYHTT